MIGESDMARMLVVDDVAMHRHKLKQIIESEGHEVVGEATDGSQAVLKYKNLKPDLVTMDIMMGENGGIEAIKRIKEYDPNAMILVVSSIAEKDIVLDALECGAHAYVLKPFDKDKVANTLQNIGFKRIDNSDEIQKLKNRNEKTKNQLDGLVNK